jgi:AcrR family transcriptional regulator
MKKQRTDGQETRQRLLVAASEVFAEKGFWETTNADICKKARVNTAAVNYHFGSKEELYIEAWKYSFERSMITHPADGGVAPEASVKQRLGARILSFMQRIADPKTYDLEIMHKEMANPTYLLTETIQKSVEPINESIKSIVKELLGDSATKQHISLCLMSILGQCFGPMLHLRRARTEPDAPRPDGLALEFGVEEIANHVIQFSLAGIRGIREESEQMQKPSKINKKEEKLQNGSNP